MRTALVLSCLLFCGCVRSTSPAPGQSADPVAEIAAHKWWKAPPSREKVERIIQAMTEAKALTAVAFDESGEVCTWKYPVPADGPEPCAQLGKRRGIIRMEADQSRRWDRESAIFLLRAKLDKLDYANP